MVLVGLKGCIFSVLFGLLHAEYRRQRPFGTARRAPASQLAAYLRPAVTWGAMGICSLSLVGHHLAVTQGSTCGCTVDYTGSFPPIFTF